MLSVFFSKSVSHHCMHDWIFASGRMKGRQPLWPEAIIRNYIRPAALRAEIAKPITWHVFRHAFSTTLLAENDEDVRMVQSLIPCNPL
jgi:site-specific recombinase XerD